MNEPVFGNVGKSARKSVLQRDQYTCKGCGLFSPSGENLTIDHMTPKSRGGVNAQWNLQVLCYDCNIRKADLTMPEWLRGKKHDEGTETISQDSDGTLVAEVAMEEPEV